MRMKHKLGEHIRKPNLREARKKLKTYNIKPVPEHQVKFVIIHIKNM